METLPKEIIELVFSVCDAKVLAIQIPQVSKLFKKYSEDNGSIWKAKCEQKYSSLNFKQSDRTWKRYYFHPNIKLFPFFGGTITKTTQEELLANKGATLEQSPYYKLVKHNLHEFWLKDGVFNRLNIIGRGILPDEWIAQGVSFAPSWIELLKLLKNNIGNYQVTEVPYQAIFASERCFKATVTAVNKEGEGADAIYYKLEFMFAFSPGTETTDNTLFQIQVQGYDDLNTFKSLYEERKCVDEPQRTQSNTMLPLSLL